MNVGSGIRSSETKGGTNNTGGQPRIGTGAGRAVGIKVTFSVFSAERMGCAGGWLNTPQTREAGRAHNRRGKGARHDKFIKENRIQRYAAVLNPSTYFLITEG
jgi:hypothetical protein